MGIYLNKTFLSYNFVKNIQTDVMRTETTWYFDRIFSLVICLNIYGMKNAEAAVRRCSSKQVFCNIHRKTPVWESIFKCKKICNFTKSNIRPWVFFTLFKLYKWYQIEQRITYFR